MHFLPCKKARAVGWDERWLLQLTYVNVDCGVVEYTGGMRTMLHHASCLIVALALALLGQGTVAHSMAAADKTLLVICGSEGAETIWVDATGSPVERDQTCIDCPECTASVGLGFNPGPLVAGILVYQDQALVRLPAGLPLAIQSHLRPATRAPPALAPLWPMTGRRTVIPMDCPRHV